ncbi:MAG: hypothetical protein WDN04_01940 [Rhodospirillales bacterium]
MHERGAGVPASLEDAATFYRQAAEKNVRSAQARWGLALLEGRGVAKNPVEGESGCAAPPTRATARRPPWWAISMPAAATCRPTSRKRRSGTTGPRKPATPRPPARSACCS